MAEHKALQTHNKQQVDRQQSRTGFIGSDRYGNFEVNADTDIKEQEFPDNMIYRQILWLHVCIWMVGTCPYQYFGRTQLTFH